MIGMRTLGLCAVSLVGAAMAFGQAFEVASVKASQTGKGGGEGSRREGVEVSPGSLIMRNVRFTTAIKWAYSVQEYQISGPGWMSDERYDIVAKAGTPAPENQLRTMLQALLKERLKLDLHRITKEMQAYVVTVGKNGHKLHESKTEGPPSLKPNGKMGVLAERADLDDLGRQLSEPLRAPVINMTGLTGRFDFTMDIAPYITEEVMKQPNSVPDIIAIAIVAIQEQLGLKLESRKVAVEILVIDRAEKTPTEN